MKIVIILPVYNEEIALFEHFIEIDKCLKRDNLLVSYMFIDDGSSDQTWEIINKIKLQFNHVEAIRFSRNFGKEFAILAGIKNVLADYYVVMDSDLQHPPQHIKPMLDKLLSEKANIIEGVKSDRGKESLAYKVVATSFYKLLYKLTNLDMNRSSDFKIMDNQVAETIRMFNERNLFFRGIVNYVGFKKVEYPFVVEERIGGKTSFNTLKLLKLALDAIISYTSRPLYATILIGGVFLVLAVLLGIQTLVNYFTGNAVSGFSTVILLNLITGSMLMLSVGIIGIYIARIYDEVKARPPFILSDKIISQEEMETTYVDKNTDK